MGYNNGAVARSTILLDKNILWQNYRTIIFSSDLPQNYISHMCNKSLFYNS